MKMGDEDGALSLNAYILYRWYLTVATHPVGVGPSTSPFCGWGNWVVRSRPTDTDTHAWLNKALNQV